MSCVYICPASFAPDPELFIQEVQFEAMETNINKWVMQWAVITGSPTGCRGNTAQMPIGEVIDAGSPGAVNENLKMLTLGARMFPLCCGCGKRSNRKPLIVVRLGHPLRCLVVASCGSNAAKGLRKHFARGARLPKSTRVGNLHSPFAADTSSLRRTRYGIDAGQPSQTE